MKTVLELGAIAGGWAVLGVFAAIGTPPLALVAIASLPGLYLGWGATKKHRAQLRAQKEAGQ